MNHDLAFRSGALSIVLLGLLTGVLLWPLPSLGFDADLQSGQVRAVYPDTPAAQAGLQAGDRILAIYGYPWSSVEQRLLLVPLPWQPGTPSPMTLERDGNIYTLVLRAGAPDLFLQIEKGIRLLVALICWSTGMLLGSSPRALDQGLRQAAWFWVLLGGTLAIYPLVAVVSYPLTVAVLWLQCSLLAPMAVAMNLWYPKRPLPAFAYGRTRRLLLGAIGLLQLGLFGLALYAGAVTVLYDWLHLLVPLVFVAGFGLSAALLGWAYRRTQIGHIRRQIHLIALACLVTTGCWIVLLLAGASDRSLHMTIPPAAYPLAASLIPLAYLAGGISADLMRLDQLMRRVAPHALAVLVLLLALLAGSETGVLSTIPIVIVLAVLALYRPLLQLAQRLVFGRDAMAGGYAPLHHAIHQLGTSLDADDLAGFVTEGIRRTFAEPPLAIYLRRDRERDQLDRVLADDIAVPPMIALPPPMLPGGLQFAATVQQQIGTHDDPSLTVLAFHTDITLWAEIRHQRGELLGLIVLGPRGDVDPYQPEDLRQLRQLLAAAGLAFANSASYAEQVAAEETIRQLYRRMQQIQEETAAAIARELHDEVLNVNVRLNLETLRRLLARTSDNQVRDELQMVIDGEENTQQQLRLICEQLHPSYSDDPLGLAASLRGLVDQQRSRWHGQITLAIEGEPIPIAPPVQRELLRIAREALINAIKHADACTITVSLRFPSSPDETLDLRICDNGRSQKPIVSRQGHHGLQYMRESARAIAASITWQRGDAGGTCVEVQVPAAQLSPADAEPDTRPVMFGAPA